MRPALTLLALLALAALLSGCGTVATRSPETDRAPDAQAGTAPRPGGYYKDDGP